MTDRGSKTNLIREIEYYPILDSSRTAVLAAKGHKIGFGYDAAGRLIREECFAAGNHATPVTSIDFSYDRIGSLVGYDDGTTAASYTNPDDLSPTFYHNRMDENQLAFFAR